VRIKFISTLLCFSLTLSPPGFAFSPYSNGELDQLEKEFVEQINQSPQIIRDPLAKQYIHHLGERLAQHGGLKTPDFFIVASNEINAFAGPGGHIGINTQLILVSDNESELAGVMAHEMAHVRLHHLYRMLEHEKQMKIPMLASLLAAAALGVLNPAMGTGALMATLGGFAQDDINFVRSNEKEADRIGIDVLHQSGLDPRGMANFFKKMQLNTRYYYTDNIPTILRTHPLDADRIAEAESRTTAMQLPPPHEELDYQLFKTLIHSIILTDNKGALERYKTCMQKNDNPTCRFGYALVLMNINQYNEAEKILEQLNLEKPDNLYYAITLSRAENGNQHAQIGIEKLQALLSTHPDNYAILNALAESAMAANNPEKAAAVLLKTTRLFPKDLPACESLARAEAANGRKNYAYFTAAQCQLLQGQEKEAKRLLKLAQSMNKKDTYLKARIEAKLDEISDT
jgi:beta-barrel assembly-enhancing protease